MSDVVTEHAPTECACPACRPERFTGGETSESLPLHLCQRCFSGQCMTVTSEKPAAEPAAQAEAQEG